MIEDIKSNLKESAEQVLHNLSGQLAKVRTGRASANVLDGISVDYYGTQTPLAQVGQISTPEARLLQIRPFDKSMIKDIEKAILKANLGLTPGNDGNLIRIPFPVLTEERRKEQVKEIKKCGEDAKIAVRNHRREQNDVVKNAEKGKEISEDDAKRFQQDIQKVVDRFIEDIDKAIVAKEKEVMAI